MSAGRPANERCNEVAEVANEALRLLTEVWQAGSAEGYFGELWALAGRLDALTQVSER